MDKNKLGIKSNLLKFLFCIQFILYEDMSANKQIGILIQKIQRHPKVEIKNPPILGPKIGPKPITKPKVPIETPLLFSGIIVVIKAGAAA